METKIQKWGNSLGVRLPKVLAQKKDLREGVLVQVSEMGDVITIKPIKNAPLSLAELLQAITEETLHTETDWGNVKGNEVW